MSDETRLRRVRRRPRFRVFLLSGAVLGFLVGAALSVMGPPDARYGAGATLGFVGLAFACLGTLLAAVVAVLLDRRS